MHNILFVCLGNICRSPMAEFIMKDIVKKKNIEKDFYIASAGTSSEELGNPVYYLAREKLNQLGINCDGKYARQLKKEDYNKFDYLLAMEENNVKAIKRICKNDSQHKIYRLLDFSQNARDIDDPYYSRNFDKTYNDIVEGIESFLKYLKY